MKALDLKVIGKLPLITILLVRSLLPICACLLLTNWSPSHALVSLLLQKEVACAQAHSLRRGRPLGEQQKYAEIKALGPNDPR